MHFSEEWFHGRLSGGRDRAEELLLHHGPRLGDGAFLVRKSCNFVGDFSLSFWYIFRFVSNLSEKLIGYYTINNYYVNHNLGDSGRCIIAIFAPNRNGVRRNTI